MSGRAPIILRADPVHGGPYRITVSDNTSGGHGRLKVYLYLRTNIGLGLCLKSGLSAADGSYIFNYLKYIENGYTAIAVFPYDQPSNMVIKDLATPEAMP